MSRREDRLEDRPDKRQDRFTLRMRQTIHTSVLRNIFNCHVEAEIISREDVNRCLEACRKLGILDTRSLSHHLDYPYNLIIHTDSELFSAPFHTILHITTHRRSGKPANAIHRAIDKLLGVLPRLPDATLFIPVTNKGFILTTYDHTVLSTANSAWIQRTTSPATILVDGPSFFTTYPLDLGALLREAEALPDPRTES